MDDVAFAVADPVRREILERLGRGVMSAGAIAALFDVSRPAISRHLRVLRECGLVADEARGRQRFYRLELAPLEPLEAWLTQLRAGAVSSAERWSGALDALETEVYRTRRDRRAAKPEALTRTEERSA